MTLEQRGDIVRMTECPFCGEDLSEKPPANHLKGCEEFYIAAGVELPGWMSDERKAAADPLSDSNGGDT